MTFNEALLTMCRRCAALLVVASAAALLQAPRRSLRRPARPPVRRAANGGDGDGESLRDAWDAGVENGKEILARFTNPVVDDQGLIIADALIAGVVAPGLEAIVCTAAGVPLPLWASAFGSRKLVLPVLVRGATEATCWYAGAVSARLYARDAYDFPPPAGADDRFATTVKRTLQAGSFATALLIGATQLQLALRYGFPAPQLGDSPETDMVLLRTLDDLLRDVATEALTLLSWRVARTELSRLDSDPTA